MAKFKVGDRVRFSGVSVFHESSGKEGRIVKIDKDYGDITIKADDGKTYTATESVAEKIANSRACNAKFKVGDWVKIKHSGAKAYITKIEGDQVVAKVPGGYNNEKYYDLEMIEPTTSSLRSTNAAVQEALNSACARNAAYPKTIDLSAGNWEATLMPRTDYLLLEKGDIRTKDYTALEGTVKEVTRKVYSSVKGVTGKDLADAKAIVAKANAEMVKYEKDERSHGRGTNSACATNSAEVEVSLQYAARVQQAMRDAVRMVSGVRQSSTNTLYCPDDDAAEEVVEILTDAGVPKNEVWINARKVRNDAGANDPKNTEAVKKMWNDFKKRLDAMMREAETLDKKAVAMKVYGVRWDNVTRKLEDAVGLMEGWN